MERRKLEAMQLITNLDASSVVERKWRQLTNKLTHRTRTPMDANRAPRCQKQSLLCHSSFLYKDSMHQIKNPWSGFLSNKKKGEELKQLLPCVYASTCNCCRHSVTQVVARRRDMHRHSTGHGHRATGKERSRQHFKAKRGRVLGAKGESSTLSARDSFGVVHYQS